MYNLDDNEILQIFKYKGNKLELYNRNFLVSEDKPLGYNKVPNTYLKINRKYQNLIGIENKDKLYYKLSWDLFLEIDKYKLLMNIYNDFLLDIKNDIESAINIYQPVVFLADKLILEDYRIIDTYSGVYKIYNIIITSISDVSEYFFNMKFIKVSLEAETI